MSAVYNYRWASPAQSLFTVSNSRLPFSSPPTTRRVTVEVFDPASTREASLRLAELLLLYLRGERNEYHVSKSSSIFVCLFVVTETCLANYCAATDVLPLLRA
jgi:hypothetical protein